MPQRLLLASALGLSVFLALLGLPRSYANPQPSEIPAWLKAHIGIGEGQIAPVVLQRARAHYQQKLSEGAIKNPCYFAMDATRPAGYGRRFYIICEGSRTFRAISSGHGNGRKLKGIADFSNGIRCAENFSNSLDSKLTTGGPYKTAEIRTSFKGYYRAGAKSAPLVRSFLQFEGEGDTANARDRAIGGHPAVVLRVQCRRKAPSSPYANEEGYVPYGTLVNYTNGRSNGCTTWSPADAAQIMQLVQGNPTTVYIYPESSDIVAVARAVKGRQSLARAGLYWNASCLREIGSPKFWPRETLEPALMRLRKAEPKSSPRPLPICR